LPGRRHREVRGPHRAGPDRPGGGTRLTTLPAPAEAGSRPICHLAYSGTGAVRVGLIQSMIAGLPIVCRKTVACSAMRDPNAALRPHGCPGALPGPATHGADASGSFRRSS
jgi:hypothetical protein